MVFSRSRLVRSWFGRALVFAALGFSATLPTHDAGAVVLQDLLDGESLEIGPWVIENWGFDYQDSQPAGGGVYIPGQAFPVREFDEVEVSGERLGLGFSVEFDLAEHYYVRGYTVWDDLRFTVRSRSPALGIGFADFGPLRFELNGDAGGVQSGLIWWADPPSIPAGYGVVATLQNGVVTTRSSTFGTAFDLIDPFCDSSSPPGPCTVPEMDLIFRLRAGASEGSFASILSSRFFVIGERVTPVSEPDGLALFAFGLAGLALARRRRRPYKSRATLRPS